MSRILWLSLSDSLRVGSRVVIALALGAALHGCGGGGSGGDQSSAGAPSYTGTGLSLSVETIDGTHIDVLPAARLSRTVTILKAEATINVAATVETPVGGVVLEQSGAVTTLSIDTSAMAAGAEVPVTIAVKNLDNGTTERATVTVKVLTPSVVAAGTLTSSGGTIMSADGSAGVEAAAGEFNSPVGVTISTATRSNGSLLVIVQFDRDTSGERARIALLPAATTTVLNVRETTLSARNQRATPTASRLADYAVNTTWMTFHAWFTDIGSHRLVNSVVPANVPELGCDGVLIPYAICAVNDIAAQLTATSSAEAELRAAIVSNTEIVPVLFVHGYNPSIFGLGGGSGTWNDFPQLVAAMSTNAVRYVPFEFQWQTNASFRVVADNLAAAIQQIYQSGGHHMVRIVAHSFGGVLARTLLQHHALQSANFDGPTYVRSLMTLGAPHSGIFDGDISFPSVNEEPSVSFHNGRDSLVFDGCNQISCHQAGELVSLAPGLRDLTDAGEVAGGLMADLARTQMPANIPVVVGIGIKKTFGLYGDGDLLLNFNGQRYHPSLFESAFDPQRPELRKELLQCQSQVSDSTNAVSQLGTRIREVVLGALDSNDQPDPTKRPNYPIVLGVRGYVHTNTSWRSPLIEYPEPYVSCAVSQGCDHAALRLFRDTINLRQQYCESGPVVAGLSPTSVPADGLSHVITIDGSRFQNGNVVQRRDTLGLYAGVWRPIGGDVTALVSSTRLTATLILGTDVNSFDIRICRSSNEAMDVDCSDRLTSIEAVAPVAAPPSVTSVTVNLASPTVGDQATFSVNGANLQSGNTFSLPGCGATEVAGGTTAQRQFVCTLTIAGANLPGMVTLPTGSVLYSFLVTVLGASPLPTPATASLTASRGFTCGVTNVGVTNADGLNVGGAKCWGFGGSGALGNGSNQSSLTPAVVVGLSAGVRAVAAGTSHTCAITSTGAVKCWGIGPSGEIGDGTGQPHAAPVDVVGLGSGAVAIAAGFDHSCAVTSAGGVRCWGGNPHGELGDGTQLVNRLAPVDVTGLNSGVSAVSAGAFFTCALTNVGGVKCWGINDSGQLGDGTSTERLTPVDVSGLTSGVLAISAGASHVCALTAGGVKCWGSNSLGQLGDGAQSNRPTPVDVLGLGSGATAVTAGVGHTCVVTSSATVKCWGGGPLGDGTQATHPLPVDVLGLTSITGIAAGEFHTCATTYAGSVNCWGSNNSGQLGDGTTVNRLTPATVVGF